MRPVAGSMLQCSAMERLEPSDQDVPVMAMATSVPTLRLTTVPRSGRRC